MPSSPRVCTLVLFIYASNIACKVILYYESQNIYIYLQRELPVTGKDSIVPVYPPKGDIVTVDGDGGEAWFARILSVDY